MSGVACTACQSNSVPAARVALGYELCLKCGEKDARKRKHTVIPLHKSNYMVPANREEIKGFNNKGGFHR
jgi:ribosomal protein L37AE/L43A